MHDMPKTTKSKHLHMFKCVISTKLDINSKNKLVSLGLRFAAAFVCNGQGFFQLQRLCLQTAPDLQNEFCSLSQSPRWINDVKWIHMREPFKK